VLVDDLEAVSLGDVECLDHRPLDTIPDGLALFVRMAVQYVDSYQWHASQG
jgi:hypothetical protein